MKHSSIFLAVLLVALLSGCDSNEPETINFQFEAEVIGKGMDCGSVYLIHLINVSGAAVITDGRYYADNLLSEYKDSGLEIALNCRLPSADEIYPCTMFGPTYPHVYVLEAQTQ